MVDIPNTLANSRLAKVVNARIGADASLMAAKATFLRLGGCSILALSLGVAAAIAFWGYARVQDKSVSAQALADALAKALEGAKITAALDPDARVKLDAQDAKVRLDPASLRDAIPRPTPEQMGAQPPQGKVVQTNYTVFKSVQFGSGEVVTGYNFAGDAQTPSAQYCYYTTGAASSGTSLQTDLARNAVFSAPANPPAKLDAKAAAANCVWFDGAATRF